MMSEGRRSDGGGDWLKQGEGRRPRLSWSLSTDAPLAGLRLARETGDVLAADASGNLFAVGLVTEPSGRQQIRVIKTDPSGNPLASFDFGGSAQDTVASAATDTQGNIVIVGSTPSTDFPIVGQIALNPLPRPNETGLPTSCLRYRIC